MITIDALLTTGESALTDLDGASPTGGQVRSETRDHSALAPGDVVRDHGAWSVVADVRHNGITGITAAGLIRKDGTFAARALVSSDVMDVRIDARIDPDTLYKLARLASGCDECGARVPDSGPLVNAAHDDGCSLHPSAVAA